MDTERLSPRYAAIDAWEPGEILDAMIEGQLAAVAAVRAVRVDLEAAALGIEARLRMGGRLVYAGAGTSGRLAAQDAAELAPTFNWPRDRVVLLLAGGNRALSEPVEGAEDDHEAAAHAVRERGIRERDVLIALAASGTTPFTLACMRGAKERGGLTIGIANNAGVPLLSEADHPIHLDTGPEAIAGSTRLKAGTAQKIALNCLSSLAMIRLGRVHGGLMVDMQAGNAKLALRAARMLRQITGCGDEQAREALARSGGSVKLAVLLLEGCASVEAAETRLEGAGGRLRDALSPVAPDPAEARPTEG